MQQKGSYIPIPFLHVGGAIQEECGPTREIVQLDNGFIIRHAEVTKSFLQGLIFIVTKCANAVSDDVLAPMLEGDFVQTLFHQKQTMAQEWERLCFLQREITITEMVNVFPSLPAHSVYQLLGTQMKTMGDAKHLQDLPARQQPLFQRNQQIQTLNGTG